MKIMTEFVPEMHEFRAVTDDYDGEGSPVGYGRSESEAIDKLMVELQDRQARTRAVDILERLENAQEIGALKVADGFKRDASGRIVAAPAVFIIAYLNSTLKVIESGLKQAQETA